MQIHSYENSPLKTLVDELYDHINSPLIKYVQKELPSIANKFKKTNLSVLDLATIALFTNNVIQLFDKDPSLKMEMHDPKVLNACVCIQKYIKNDDNSFKGLSKIAPFINSQFKDTATILKYSCTIEYKSNDLAISLKRQDITTYNSQNFFAQINEYINQHITSINNTITLNFQHNFPCSRVVKNINLSNLSFDEISITDWNDGINKLNDLEACITEDQLSTESDLLCLINEKYVLIKTNPATTNNKIIEKAKKQIIRKLKNIINTELQNLINRQTASSRQQLSFTIGENMKISKELKQDLNDATRKIETDFTNKTKEQEKQDLAEKLDENALIHTQNTLKNALNDTLVMITAYGNFISADNAAEGSTSEASNAQKLEQIKIYSQDILKIEKKINFIKNVISVQDKLKNPIALTALREIQPPVAPENSGFKHIQTAIAARIQNKIEDTNFNNITAEIAALTKCPDNSWISTRISTLHNDNYKQQLQKLFNDKTLELEKELRQNIWNNLENQIKTRFAWVYEKKSTEELLQKFYDEITCQIYIKINDYNRQPLVGINNDANKYVQIDTNIIAIITENLKAINKTIKTEDEKCEKENYNHKMYSILTLGIYALARLVYILIAHKEFYSTNKYQACKNEVAALNKNLSELSSNSISAN